MKNKTTFLKLTLPVTVLGLSTAHSAVIVPQSGGGAAIDPSGNSEIDAAATGSALLSTFEALAGRTTQVNWTGISGATGNTIDGSDIDVRIDHGTPGFVASSSSLQNYNTGSSGDGYQWLGTNGHQLTISFGTESSGFTNDRSVQSAGFALLNFGGAYTDVTINYLDASDAVLSTQNFVGTPDSQGSAFGWTGRAKDWQRFEEVSLVLAGLATPLVLSVHTIVSFDFANPEKIAPATK